MSIDRVWGIPIAGLDRIHGVTKTGLDRIHGLSGIPADDGGTPATLPTPTYYWSLDDKLTDEIGSYALTTADTPAYASAFYGNGLVDTDFTAEYSNVVNNPTGFIVSAWLKGESALFLWEGASGLGVGHSVSGGGSATLRHAVIVASSTGNVSRTYYNGVLDATTYIDTIATLQTPQIVLGTPASGTIDEACVVISPTVSGTFATWANSIASALYNSGVGMVYRSGSGWIDPGEAI